MKMGMASPRITFRRGNGTKRLPQQATILASRRKLSACSMKRDTAFRKIPTRRMNGGRKPPPRVIQRRGNLSTSKNRRNDCWRREFAPQAWRDKALPQFFVLGDEAKASFIAVEAWTACTRTCSPPRGAGRKAEVDARETGIERVEKPYPFRHPLPPARPSPCS